MFNVIGFITFKMARIISLFAVVTLLFAWQSEMGTLKT